MPAATVLRPVWRRFQSRFTDRAITWVRDGGAAAVVQDDDPKRVDVILGTTPRGAITEAAYWALLAVEQKRWVRIQDGRGKGLGTARVQPHALPAVLDWCERDSIHPGPTRKLRFDCLECGACCHDSNVILYPEDLARFRDAGRDDLMTSKYVVRRDGKLRLRFVAKGACQHLQGDLKCSIYALRPFNCSVFPVASEACLAARESTLGLRDGAPEAG